MEKLGIYVHIPYCLKKCLYCDFVSFPKDSELSVDPDSYCYKVCDEIEETPEEIKEKYTVDSVFFGGGTPNCIGTDQIGRILLAIKKSFKVSEDAEISIEANPETVTLKKAENLKALGFNRVSMGVQSLDDKVLEALGRVHSAAKAIEAYGYLRQAGFENINVDLMLGVPGQSLKSWAESLEKVIELSPEHVSFYSLQIEEGTPFYEGYKEGSLEVPSWEENRAMYDVALDKLKRAGYVHYEISNAAKPGFSCRHNIKYWTMKPYLGFGTSAHSFMDGKRFYNTDELEYQRVYEESESPEDEVLDRMGDFVFTELRLINGIDLWQFKEVFGRDFEEIFEEALSDKGLKPYLEIQSDEKGKLTALSLSRRGLDNTNMVMQRFLEVLYQ